MTFVITTFILLMQFLWRYIEDLVGKGLDAAVIAKLMLYTTASLVPMALPLAVLLASIMTFGNLGENYELTALKSAGISLQRIMKPLIYLNIIISIFAFYVSNNVIPFANLKMRSLMYDIQRQKPEFQIREGSFYSEIDGYSIKIGKKNNETGMIYDLKIYNHTAEQGNTKITIADSGTMKMAADESNLVVKLYSGYNYEEVRQASNPVDISRPHRKDHYKTQEMLLDLSGFGLHRTDENLFKSGYKMMNLNQLDTYEDSLIAEIKEKQAHFVMVYTGSNYFKNSTIHSDSGIAFVSSRDQIIMKDKIYTSLDNDARSRVITHSLYAARAIKEQLSYASWDLVAKMKNLRKYQIEWHRKFTLSIACLIFFFIGAPLGAIIRKGGFGMPIVTSILFFIFYYIISLMSEKFVKELQILPWEGMWIPSAVLLPIGVFLTYKATRDSSLFNIEYYTRFFKTINSVVKRYQSNPKL